MTGVQTICGSCGSAVRVGAAFCPRCGGAQRSVAAAGAGGTPMSPPVAAAPAHGGLDPALIAPPGLRVVSWVVELVALGLVTLAIGVLLTLVATSAVMGGASFTTWLFVAAWVPLVGLFAWVAAMWVWEARTGNRIGNLVTRVRTVDAATGSSPGLAKVLGSRMIVGLASAVGFGVVTAIRQATGGLGSAEVWLPTLIQGGLSLVVVGSGAWGAVPLRQGWHERASGTTVVRVVRGARHGQMLGSLGAKLASAPDTAATPVALLHVEMPGEPTALVQPSLAQQVPPQATPYPVPTSSSGGMIADVPGFAPSAPSPDPLHASPVARSAAPMAMPAPAPAAESDDIEHTRISRRDRRASPAYRLSFDTGEVVDLAGPGLVGRAPQAAPGEVVEHLVAIDDPDRSVSKTHLAFGLDAGGLWVADRESTNGTRVVQQGGEPIEVGASPVGVPDDASVQFGERSFRVRRG